MSHKILFILQFLIVGMLECKSQEYHMASFEVVPDDLTARIESRVDMNGINCALLKIQVNDSLYTVQGNIVGNFEKKGMETYVYMTEGSKEVKLVFNNYLPLHIKFQDFQVENLVSSMTYILKLSSVLGSDITVNDDFEEKSVINYTSDEYEWVDFGLPSGLKWATCNIGA